MQSAAKNISNIISQQLFYSNYSEVQKYVNLHFFFNSNRKQSISSRTMEDLNNV